MIFHKYFKEWMELYKKPHVAKITYGKYENTYRHLMELAPSLDIKKIDKRTYQKLLNDYALNHEKQTVMDFHHQIKAAILDAYDEGIIKRNPTRNAIVTGKNPSEKKIKFLNQSELKTLIETLDLGNKINYDWLLLLIAKTGLRFGEAIAVTPDDFDFKNKILAVNKTWNYKDKNGGFMPTKNLSSNRKVQIDWQTCMQFQPLLSDLIHDEPVFAKSFGDKGRIFSSTVNDYLERLCRSAGVTVISVHGLRHTHASLLLFAGVSTASVSKRLGHSNMTTTQNTYMHIVQELEDRDKNKVMEYLSGL